MASTFLLPLGGLGEIGLNALAVESETDLVLVDCGLVFPEPGQGLDGLIPDFSYLTERKEKLRAIFLTHGHDDHVGALPYLLRDLPVPVYGTAMTLGLAEPRLREILPAGLALLRAVRPGETADAGSLRAQFLRVTHSVPDASALGLLTPGGSVLHTGDFKFDPSPVDGRLTDEAGLAAWGERGVDLLCCDSTNAHRPGFTPSERGVGVALRRVFSQARGRVYVVTFSSHAHRVQQVLEASREAGRTAALLGRTLIAAARTARRLGHLRPAPGDLVPEKRLETLPRARQTVLLPGSQGEEGSAFYRVASGLEARHRLLPGDEVILSARRIPGNEPAIDALIGRCLRSGARVQWDEGAGVHASGHGSAGDVARMLDLTRPRHVLPVHGELRHLDALARVAEAWGVAPEAIFRIENGQGLLLEEGRVRLGPQAATGRVLVERGLCAPASDSMVSDRARLGREGVVLATLRPLPAGAHREGWAVRISLLGVVPAAERPNTEAEAEAAVLRHLADHPSDPGEPSQAEAAVALALRKHFRRFGGRRPLLKVAAWGADQAAGVDSGEPPPLK